MKAQQKSWRDSLRCEKSEIEWDFYEMLWETMRHPDILCMWPRVWLQAASWFVRRATWDLCLRHGVGDILSMSSHGWLDDLFVSNLHKLYTLFHEHLLHNIFHQCILFHKVVVLHRSMVFKLRHVRPLSSGSLIPDVQSMALQAIYFITELALAADPADFEALYGISIPEPSLPGAPFRRRVSACLGVGGSCW